VIVEPANIDQIITARDGRWVAIDRDVGSIAQQLREFDPSLRVRLNERAGIWAIFHHNELPDGSTRDDLVTTCQAHQGPTGAWLGLDQRIVDRLRFIASDQYDFLKDLEATNEKATREHEERNRERLLDFGERGFHAARIDLGLHSRPVTVKEKPRG